MWYSNVDVFSLIVGLLFLVAGLIYVVALVIPSLGRRVYGKLWPRNFTEPAQKRAAALRGVAFAGFFSFLGLYFILHQIINLTCGIQDTLQIASFVSILLATLCVLFASIVQRKGGISDDIEHKDKRITRIGAIAAIVLVIGMLAGFFFLIRSILNRTFEPIERVQMVSTTEGWAIGNVDFSGVMYHYTNGRWTQEPIPDTHLLTDLSMISATEGWAVSDGATMLHFKNGIWTAVPSPVHELTGISMVSPDEGWAVGNFGNILHYSNSAWVKATSPTTKTLASISMVSTDEGWVVGGGDYFSKKASILLHYQHGVWRIADNPVPESLYRIRMMSATEGWAVGGTQFSPTASVILHYHDGQWTQVASPANIPIEDITMVSPTEGWAVGGDFFTVPLTCPGSYRSVEMNILLHYINGIWIKVASPTDEALKGIAMSSADDGWIVGWNTFLHYVNGKWEVVQPVKE